MFKKIRRYFFFLDLCIHNKITHFYINGIFEAVGSYLVAADFGAFFIAAIVFSGSCLAL